ncbi:methyl-accepting chemotaxis protein [uncultured Roseibium sp.]|uniref:methyl-accepting chemotaxis protein n=1 Tax=uncultured Roseibium sp. TaxID=1936171 RepID=UPI003217B31F
MIRKRLSTKLALMFLAGTTVMCLAIVLVTSYLASGVANTQANAALKSATLGKQKTLELALEQVRDSAGFFVSLEDAKDALLKANAGWKSLEDGEKPELRKFFVDDNPNPADQRYLLVTPEGADNYYITNHEIVHQAFKKIVDQGLFGDIALMSPEGDFVYSYNKGSEFARNIAAPELAQNTFKLALDQIITAAGDETLKPGTMYSSGFVVSDSGRVALVIAAPIYYMDRYFGAVGLSVNMNRFATLLNEPTGIAEHETNFLVDSKGTAIELGADGSALRSFQFADVQNGPDLLSLDDTLYRFFRSEAHVHDKTYGVIEAVPQTELAAAANKIIYGVILVGIVCMLPIVGLIWWLTVRMFAPLNTLNAAARRIADGELEVDIDATERGDEIGDMARCIEIFKDNSIERERLAEERKVGHVAREEREQLIDSLINGFRAEAQQVLAVVEENIRRVEDLSNVLSDRSAAAAERGAGAVSDSENASANVQAVASATEELNASIAEISRQVATTAEIVGQTTFSAQTSNQKIEGLAEAANKIGDVVSLISEIAEQTNLLALNATIEAARAGEAGRGFAVVASEVKSLAEQTAKATEEISAQISAIQASTTDAVQEIQNVSSSIEEVNNYTTTISSAVQQQGSATSEISQNVTEAAGGTRNVSEAVASLNDDVVENSRSVEQMREATLEMKQQAEQLRKSVETFLAEVAAA